MMKRLIAGVLPMLLLLSMRVLPSLAETAAVQVSRIVPGRASLPGEDTPQSSTHHLGVQVQGSALTQLVINLPADVTPPATVQVVDQTGKVLTTTIALTTDRVTINFAKPVPVGTTLQINLQGVQRRTSANVVVYQVAVRQFGATALIDIGTASVRAYGPLP